jgi:indolepyruvate ferredoxin oxidoreductase alpha subunit
MARLAKVPVLDPSDPAEAREMVRIALEISEAHRIPVILRPAIRVCHARQNLSRGALENNSEPARFEKDPARWAATPKFRYLLHGELNRKLAEIGERFSSLTSVNRHDLTPGKRYPLGIVAGGVPWAVVRDLLQSSGREDVPVLKLGAPWPFPEKLCRQFASACDKLLVLEETDTLIEYLLGDRKNTLGRHSGHVPPEGELVPQVVAGCIDAALKTVGQPPLDGYADSEIAGLVQRLELPIRRPTLCPGCPHRASFFAIRRAAPKAIYTSDIGCYTLGLNLGGVDTCLDMGAGITMASGFYHAFAQDGVDHPVVATMGDSTFYHSGTAGLISAVYNDARFILVVLDNMTTAMTGMQPSIALGKRADGSQGRAIPLERVIRGCGVEFVRVVDPYDLKAMRQLLKQAAAYTTDPEGGIAVIVARHPCLIAFRQEAVPDPVKIKVTEDCDLCNVCHERFECPALVRDEKLERTVVNYAICTGCGVCLQVCPKGAIVEAE